MNINNIKKESFIIKNIDIVLFFILLLNTIILFNSKVYASNVTDFTYKTSGNNAIITAYKGTKSDITIPAKIGSYKVVGIDNHAFNIKRNQTNGQLIKNVIISEGISYIGDFAFINCTNLVYIKLPNSLTSLGDQTFIGCTNLKNINIPPKIKSFGYSGYMFQETGFTTFTVPKNVEKIPSCTFRICKQLKQIYIYSDNVLLGEDIFEYCSNDIIIYGNKGSSAEAYAKNNNYTFKQLPSTTKPSSPVAATGLKLNKTSLSLIKGNKGLLTATFLPAGAKKSTLIWASSNPNIVSVTNGILQAKDTGSVIIYVATSDKKLTASCKITVIDKTAGTTIPVSAIKLDKITLKLTPGSTETITPTILPANATDKTLIWQSDNEEIATVNDGFITAISEGKATIQVTSADGSAIAACDVYVSSQKSNNESSVDDSFQADSSNKDSNNTGAKNDGNKDKPNINNETEEGEYLTWDDAIPVLIPVVINALLIALSPAILIIIFVLAIKRSSKNASNEMERNKERLKIIFEKSKKK